MPGRWATGIGVALLTLLVAAVPAQAAFNRTPIELGPSDGGSPGVVVDPAGTAHAVWGVAEDVMRYCAIPRGARTCAQPAPLQLDARSGRPYLLRRAQDGLLVAVVGRYAPSDDVAETTWAFTSLDGVTWSGPVQIGSGVGKELVSVSLTADGAAVDLLDSDSVGNDFQRAPLAGAAPPTVVDLTGTTPFYDAGGVVPLRGGRTMAVLGSTGDGIAYRLLAAGADPFADANWSAARPVTREADDPRVAGGPGGTYVLYRKHPLDQIRGSAPVVVRRFRGDRWARPRGLMYEVDANSDRTALVEDGRGRLHAAIVGNAASGRRACITYARTRKGRWFTRAVSLHQTSRASEHPGRIQLAVDGRGRGVVAWATPSGVARLQRLKAGRGVTGPVNPLRRGCPGFPR